MYIFFHRESNTKFRKKQNSYFLHFIFIFLSHACFNRMFGGLNLTFKIHSLWFKQTYYTHLKYSVFQHAMNVNFEIYQELEKMQTLYDFVIISLRLRTAICKIYIRFSLKGRRNCNRFHFTEQKYREKIINNFLWTWCIFT